MKAIRMYIVINCILYVVIFVSVLKWALVGGGVAYFEAASNISKSLFYALLAASMVYSAYVSFSLGALRGAAIRMVLTWNIFLGMCILVPLIGGYFVLNKHDLTATMLALSSWKNLTKITLGASSIALGLMLKGKKLRQNFRD